MPVLSNATRGAFRGLIWAGVPATLCLVTATLTRGAPSQAHKIPFAHDVEFCKDLTTAIHRLKPTALIGLLPRPGHGPLINSVRSDFGLDQACHQRR